MLQLLLQGLISAKNYGINTFAAATAAAAACHLQWGEAYGDAFIQAFHDYFSVSGSG